MSKQLIKKNGFEALEVFETGAIDNSSEEEGNDASQIVAIKTKKKNRRKRNRKAKQTVKGHDTCRHRGS